MKAIWGVEIEIGMNMLEIIGDPLDREKARKNFERTLRGEQLILIEEYGDPTKYRTYYENRYSPIANVAGVVSGVTVFVTDITERKRAENALLLSEETYRGILNSISEAVYIQDPNGLFLDVNQAAEKLYDYTKEDFIGRTPEFLSAPGKNDLAKLGAYLEQTLNGEPQSFEFWGLRKDGTIFPKEVSNTLGYYFGKKVNIAVARDITERKQAEDALRASEEKFRNLFNNSEVGMFRVRLDGSEVLEFNEKYLKILNYTWEELKGVPSVNLWADKHEREQMVELLNTKGHVTDFECGILSKQGVVRRCIMSVRLYGDTGILEGSIQDITERKQAEESIHQRVLELETINRISLVLRATLKQEEMLSIVLDEALAILNTSHGSIELYNKTTYKLDRIIMRGWMAQITAPQPLSEGIAGKVFISGELYISHEFVVDPETHPASLSQIPPGWGGICLPIRTTQQTLGVMIISIPSEHQLDKDEIRLLAILSEMTGAALQRMQLHEQTVRRLEQLNGLRTVDQAISSSRDIHLTLNILLTHTLFQLNVDAADVLLLHPGSNLLELVVGRGFHTLVFENVNVSNSLAGHAIMEHRSIMTLNSESAVLYENSKFGKFWKMEGFACYWCVPLIIKGEAKGVLEVYRRTAFTPDAEWLEFLEALAGQAAITIDNTQLFENLQRANTDLSLAYDATIEGWSRAMDLRDHETEGHTLRVTDLTLKLARVMRINESQLTAIRRGALLHDIGKMGIPDSILLKEGKLTDEEWVLMRKHPQLAHDMLAPIAYLHDALDIPYCHHEKWDGTGYPQGLAGENIPLVARIFAVVDVWDAITNDRTYRKKWTEQKARQYIKEQNGKHFDPQVVDVFLDIIGEEDKTP